MGKNNSNKKEKTEYQKWQSAFAKIDYQVKKEQEEIRARLNKGGDKK